MLWMWIEDWESSRAQDLNVKVYFECKEWATVLRRGRSPFYSHGSKTSHYYADYHITGKHRTSPVGIQNQRSLGWTD
jgi:hypothetical protein